MRRDFLHMSVELLQRPITDEELAALRRHAERVRHTPAVALALKHHEQDIVHATVTKLYQRYPQQLERYALTEVKTRRDMRSVLGYCLYSVVLDDPDYAKDKMLYWYRTILNAFEFGQTFVEDAYRLLQAEVVAHLGAETSAPLSVMLDEAIAVFNDPHMG